METTTDTASPIDIPVMPRALLLTHKDGRETLHPMSEYTTAYRDTAVSQTLLYDQPTFSADAAPYLLAALQRLLRAHYSDGITYGGDHPAAEARRAVAKAQSVELEHSSDCAVHNMPAYPNGPCDCGAI